MRSPAYTGATLANPRLWVLAATTLVLFAAAVMGVA